MQDPRKEYKFGSELGHGNYGVVHLVTHTQSGRVYACKILRKQSKLNQQHIMTEIEALHHVDSHPNIATLHEVKCPCLVVINYNCFQSFPVLLPILRQHTSSSGYHSKQYGC